jgi:hypothetical protein
MTDVLQEAPPFDVTYWARELDELFAKTPDPRQRAMILSMRRHILLEMSGRWREVLTPEYCVDNPKYRVVTPLGAAEYNGLDQVLGFYGDLFDKGSGVWSPLEDELNVTDHSIIGEGHLAAFVPGYVLAEQGVDVVDEKSWYMSTFRQVYIFDFAPDGRLIGERSYDSGSSELFLVPPGKEVTFEKAARILKPYLDNPPT